MAVLARLLIGSQQRVDLADFLSIQSYVASDFKELIKSFIGSRPIVLKGFEIISAPESIGTNSISIKIANSVLYDPTSSAGSFYSGLPEGSELSQPIVLGQELRAGTSTTSVTNYVYLTLTTQGAAQDTRAFWDVDLNGGEGGEFNQTINTEAVIQVQAGVSTSGFPQGSIPLAKVVYGTSIQEITDCRNMMFRLGSGGTSPDPNARFQFPALPSSAYSRNEPPSTINSAALPSPFFGGDKNIQTLKDWMDVVMTKLVELSGTTYWYESTGDLSLVNVYDDALGSSLKSKGQWIHDENSVGSVQWTEDIIYRKMNDPRDIIVRGGSKSLANEQVMWIQLVRNQKINELDLPVLFVPNSQVVKSTSDTDTGRFSNLKLGDWIKAKGDNENLYCRVIGFYTDLTASENKQTTIPSNACSVKLETPYNGAGGLSNAVYTKGVYDNTEVTVSDRDDTSLYEAGGNMYWLASRSDTIQSISNVDVQYRESVIIDEADGKSAKIIFSTNHGLLNGDRVVVSGGTDFDGTYEVEKISATEVSIQTPITGSTSSANVGWMVITTTQRSPAKSTFVIESENHGFASGQTVKLSGITPSTPVDINQEYIINNRSVTEFQIPYNGDQDISRELSLNNALATCAKVVLKTALGAIEVVQGETIDINEPDTANILDFIGMESLAEINPLYNVPSDSNNNMLNGTVNYNSSSQDSLKDRASRLTAMMADRVQDRDLDILGRASFKSGITQATPATNLDGDFDDTVNSIVETSDGSVIAVGKFTSAQSISVGRIAKFQTDGTLDTTFNTNATLNFTCNDITELSDGSIIIGGDFTTVGGTINVKRLAKLSSTGVLDTAFNTTIGNGISSGVVNKVGQLSDGSILVGGSFTAIGTNSVGYIAKLDTSGNLDATFSSNIGTGFDSSVRSFYQLSDGSIIVVGSFTSLNGTTVGGIAKLDINGNLDTTFNTNIGTGATGGSPLSILELSDNSIVIGGFITGFNGTPVGRIIKLDSNGNFDSTFNSNIVAGFNAAVEDLISYDGSIIVSGQFTSFNLNTVGYIAQIEEDGTFNPLLDLNSGTGFNNRVYKALKLSDSSLSFGGDFTSFNGTTYSKFLLQAVSQAGADTIYVEGDSLIVNKPGSLSQQVNLASSYDISNNQALIIDLDRNSDVVITPSIVDFDSNYQIRENRLVLLRRDSSSNVYSWDGSRIAPGDSWTSNDTESAQNKNIMMQERVSVTYDGSSILEFVSSIGYNYIKIPGSGDNIIDVSSFTTGIPLTDGQSIWVRINRRVQKTFNNYKTDISYVDDDSNGTIYVCDTDSVPVGQDVVVLYSADASVLIRHLFNPPPSQNIYEEYEVLTVDVSSGGSIQLPLDSRNGGNQRYYITGSGQLEVYLNGQKLKLDEDYEEVGLAGTIQASITVLSDFIIGDEVCFRIASEGAVYTVDLGTTTTLQQAYDQGRNINVLDGAPVNVSANPGEDALRLTGDLRLNGLLGGFTEISGEVGPTGIEFLPMASSPLDPSRSGIWIRDDDHFIQERPGEAVPTIDFTEAVLNPEYFLVGGDGIDVTADTISVDLAPDSGLEIDAEKLRAATSANSPIIRQPDGLDVKLEASDTSLQVVSNELGVKVDPAGAILKNADGVGISVDGTSIQIQGNQLVVSGVPNLLSVFTNNTGDTITAGSIVAASSVEGEIVLASASSLSNASKIVGVAYADILDGESGQVQTAGIATVGTGLTIGSPVYLSATVAGGATQTKPNAYGNALVILGVAVSATEIAWKPNKVSVISNVYLESYEVVDVTPVKEVTSVSFLNNGEFYKGTTGKYWKLNSAEDATEYYVWYNASDVTTSLDPMPVGFTGIQIDILDTDTSIEITDKTVNAIKSISDFDASAGIVEVTNAAVGATTDAADVDAGVLISVTTDGDASNAEVTEVTMTLDGASLDGATGKYWTLSSATDATSYYVWYNVTDGTPPADPAPVGLTGIQVDILYLDTVEEVANKTAAAIDSVVDFNALKLSKLNVTNTATGATTDALDFDTGFTISIAADGDAVTAESTDISIGVDGSILDAEIGKYFTIYSAGDITPYYVWYSVTNTSTPADPAPAGLTGIQVDILNTDTNIDIATKTYTAIDLLSDFDVVDNTGSIQITNAVAGATTNASDVDASVSISVTTQGVTGKIGLDPNETIDIPLDSRASNAVRQYSVGDALLTVWLNGVKQKEGEDYNEVGAPGSLSNKVQIIDGSNAGDVWEFRIERDQALVNAINGL